MQKALKETIKVLSLIMFSIISFPIFSEDSSMGELIHTFEHINRSDTQLNCSPDGTPTAPQPEGPEPQNIITKFKSLSHNNKNLDCQEKVIKGCAYHQCDAPTNMFTTYPKPLAILIPNHMTEVKSYNVHFHGFSYFNKPYDKSLDSMVNAFEFGTSTCKKTSELMIIPFSKNNKNTHHHTYLAGTMKFDGFMKEFQEAIGDQKMSPVHLSGHSGGGKVASKIVSYIEHDSNSTSATRRVKSVNVYDGLYGQSWGENYSSWFKKSKGVELNIFSIKNSPTHNHSHTLFHRYGNNAQTVTRTNPETSRPFTMKTNQWGENKIKLVQEKARGGDHHWEMNRDFWGFDF
ncbi:MAG: hypothetical protein KC493_11060 [Bacteriovoracaceae bacterium]|nr:hypothetical protein [Bacteriovoracaceae bacterium]